MWHSEGAEWGQQVTASPSVFPGSLTCLWEPASVGQWPNPQDQQNGNSRERHTFGVLLPGDLLSHINLLILLFLGLTRLGTQRTLKTFSMSCLVDGLKVFREANFILR